MSSTDEKTSQAWDNVVQCQRDSKRWFPDTSPTLPFMTLAMCGEAGELANVVKKIARGSLDPTDAAVKRQLAMESVDVLIYLYNIFGILGIDPQKAYDMKRVENERRFGHH